MGPILILGARSWVGYRLIEALRACAPGLPVAGTSGARSPPNGLLPADTPADFADMLASLRPRTVVNLLRHEDERAREIHRSVAASCRASGAHYTFVSSALVFDARAGERLTEALPPLSCSPYGQFKADCESDLQDAGGEWLIARFASIHGSSPWKPTRTESLLSRLNQGAEVAVHKGVVQNRLLDKVLADALARSILDRRTGIMHFGTTDCSDELSFLRRVAAAFGLPAGRVVAAGERSVNLAVLPERLLDHYGARFERSESQTIEGLLSCPELQRYKVSAQRQ